ncbi:MAG: transposase, partial [Gammaproteobacteria bacterium]|nr:transposase [Gammaproteobacteria bacterium]
TITHRIALDPTDRQETRLRQHAGWARFAWNWGVAETRRALDAGEKSATSHYRCRPAFNRVKAGIAPWSAVLSQNAAKYALIDLGTAWARLWRARREGKEAGRGFDRRCRPPRSHSRKRGMAFRADNGPDTVRCDGRTLRLPVIGTVRAREACRFAGPVHECTVKHDGVRWQAAVVCEVPDPEPKAVGAVVGVDVGLRRLATVHDGVVSETIDNPRPLKGTLSKLRRVNRRIARSRIIHGKKRHSNRRERRYAERRRLYRRVSDLRLDAAHKATTAIAKQSRLVCVESLHVAGWMRNRSLSRATADAARLHRASEVEVRTRRGATGRSRPVLSVEQDVLGVRDGERRPGYGRNVVLSELRCGPSPRRQRRVESAPPRSGG